MSATYELPTYQPSEVLHCPYCHEPIEMVRRTPEGTYTGGCKCGVRLGATVAVYGTPAKVGD